MFARYTVVIIAADGTMSVCGSFTSKDRAQGTADKAERLAPGITVTVLPIENIADVLAELERHREEG